MAKRKRLTPAQPDYLSSRPVVPPRGALPIANVAGDAATVAALEEVSEVLRVARTEGLLIQKLPLEEVVTDYLVRDRLIAEEDDLATLIESLRAHGQRTPIEASILEDGRYGLISGGRRMMALRRLYAQTNDARFATVLAILRTPTSSADAYVAMVEENEIRVGLSYYERARITLRSVESGVFEDTQKALHGLFAAASRAKRSKIGSFISLVQHLDGALVFPTALGERAGLTLSRAIAEVDGLSERLRADLLDSPAITAEEELSRLTAAIHASQTKPRAKAVLPSAKVDEVQPGVFLKVAGSKAKPQLVLSGPKVDAAFQEKLQAWLRQNT